MTKIRFNEAKAIIYKDKTKHYFRKFEGYGIQIKDLFEIQLKGVTKIAIIITDGECQDIKYSTPSDWMKHGIAWRFEQGDIKENQIILPIKHMS